MYPSAKPQDYLPVKKATNYREELFPYREEGMEEGREEARGTRQLCFLLQTLQNEKLSIRVDTEE